MFGAVPDWVPAMPKPKRDEPVNEHYEVELTPKMRVALLKLLKGGEGSGMTEPAVKLVVRQLELARLIDTPLFAARLDWDELEAEARRQGCSAVDVLWDRAGHESVG